MIEPTVTLYGRPSCPPCMRTKKLLDQASLDFLYIDVDQDQAALDGLTELDWVTALPVVITPALEWCGCRPEHIKTIITQYGPPA
ncbi:glutaredoxin family protein [Rhodococcus sp. IEGM 1408]|uniref:glutaredoxin family protein n=1 Tax=Rhodococcus sp. IEGM 1408 TaxID=3082220 RepID=UPI0029534EF1|nr:glutaredoxin family protein [Rhodococcus sp. IEGM 1408]MDV8002861.1 glutaredoxin family protein [Rhodococcus sp. IEGM 1408]